MTPEDVEPPPVCGHFGGGESVVKPTLGGRFLCAGAAVDGAEVPAQHVIDVTFGGLPGAVTRYYTKCYYVIA